MRPRSPQQRQLLRLALGVAVLCFIAGLVLGYLHPIEAPAGRSVSIEADILPPPIPRDAALAVISRYRHWGVFQPVQPQMSGLAGLDLTKSFQMVGVERVGDHTVALLLYRAGGPVSPDHLVAVPDADNMLRLGKGDLLIDGVRVSQVSPAAVTLSGIAQTEDAADAGHAPQPLSWTLSMYPAARPEK